MVDGIGSSGMEVPDAPKEVNETPEKITEAREVVEETKKIEDATFEPEAALEKGDIQQAEAVQEAFVATVPVVETVQMVETPPADTSLDGQTHDPEDHYSGVEMSQGEVLEDNDLNKESTKNEVAETAGQQATMETKEQEIQQAEMLDKVGEAPNLPDEKMPSLAEGSDPSVTPERNTNVRTQTVMDNIAGQTESVRGAVESLTAANAQVQDLLDELQSESPTQEGEASSIPDKAETTEFFRDTKGDVIDFTAIVTGGDSRSDPSLPDATPEKTTSRKAFDHIDAGRLNIAADSVMSAGQNAAPVIPDSSVLSEAGSGEGHTADIAGEIVSPSASIDNLDSGETSDSGSITPLESQAALIAPGSIVVAEEGTVYLAEEENVEEFLEHPYYWTRSEWSVYYARFMDDLTTALSETEKELSEWPDIPDDERRIAPYWEWWYGNFLSTGPSIHLLSYSFNKQEYQEHTDSLRTVYLRYQAMDIDEFIDSIVLEDPKSRTTGGSLGTVSGG